MGKEMKVLFMGILSPRISLEHIDGLEQDCSNSIANAMEFLQSYTEP